MLPPEDQPAVQVLGAGGRGAGQLIGHIGAQRHIRWLGRRRAALTAAVVERATALGHFFLTALPLPRRIMASWQRCYCDMNYSIQKFGGG